MSDFSVAIATVYSYAYMTGGSLCAGNQAFELDIDGNDWEQLPDLKERRFGHCSIMLGTYLYVLGSQYGSSTLRDSIEMIDTIWRASSSWQIVL